MNRETSGAVLEMPGEDAAPDEGESRAGLNVVVGILSGFGENGRASVAIPGSTTDEALSARSIVPLDQSQIGRQVVLVFERDDRRSPIVMGVLQEHVGLAQPPKAMRSAAEAEENRERETVVLTAKREIVLRCGQASVTLTRAGKILIRGAYLLSRSSGVNRIKGGTVQIN